jgi:FkbM family methyltransferase
MKQLLKSIIKSIIPQKIQDIFTYPLSLEIEKLQKRTLCFSQEGEDLILETFFDGVKKGFFVDIGSYHPIKYSNTYLFYLKGWTGINIDARPESMKIFNQIRPNDINLELAVGGKEETLSYYMFDEPALNGFSKEISEDRNKNTPFKIQKIVGIPLKRLETILDENLPHNTAIQFMSIDVEGLDLEVLQSNNWEKYKPFIMLVETSVVSQGLAMDSPIHLFLTEKGYELVAKTYRTSFYKLK